MAGTALPPREFAAALGALSGRLVGLARVASEGLIDGMESIAAAAVERLKERTPRSPDDGEDPADHIADGWTVQTPPVTRPGMFELDVVNVNPRAHDPIAIKGGGETTLLTILEYGSKPHEIVPVNAQALHFFSRGGGEIFAAHVEHPGTEPYAMVAMTATEVALDMKKLIDATRRELALRYIGRTS